ncbi:response regulator transcription factor [Natronomonas sp. EA1]|uniref:response regulator transcription factor n=1 Tax=Natronomonas sp. EA1 TaxID=3421655 RepID=UPI003EC12390
MPADRPRVLVVEDEPALAELYGIWLSGSAEPTVVTDGAAALEAVGDADVALLDRRMPAMSGDEVLAAFRERGHDLPVAFVTAVTPDVSLADAPCDAYLLKPLDRALALDAVARLAARTTLPPEQRELAALVERRSVIEDALTTSELAENDTYRALLRRIKRQESEAGITVDELPPELFVSPLSGGTI